MIRGEVRHKYMRSERQCYTLSFRQKYIDSEKLLNLDPRNIAFVVFEWKMQDHVKQVFQRREDRGGVNCCAVTHIVAYLVHTRGIRLDLGKGSTHRRETLDQLLLQRADSDGDGFHKCQSTHIGRYMMGVGVKKHTDFKNIFLPERRSKPARTSLVFFGLKCVSNFCRFFRWLMNSDDCPSHT